MRKRFLRTWGGGELLLSSIHSEHFAFISVSSCILRLLTFEVSTLSLAKLKYICKRLSFYSFTDLCNWWAVTIEREEK